MTTEEQAGKMNQVVTRAGRDEGYRQRLVSNPAAVLEEEGLEIPPGVEVRTVENTGNVFHLVLPAMQPSGELSEEELSAVAGGFLKFTFNTVFVTSVH